MNANDMADYLKKLTDELRNKDPLLQRGIEQDRVYPLLPNKSGTAYRFIIISKKTEKKWRWICCTRDHIYYTGIAGNEMNALQNAQVKWATSH